MSNSLHPGALPFTGTYPSSTVKVLTIAMLSCVCAAFLARVEFLLVSQAAGDLAPKSHFSICFLPVIISTVADWMEQSQRWKLACRKFLREHSQIHTSERNGRKQY